MAEEKVSRRDFIKGLGAAGAVASVAAVFAEAKSSAVAPSAYAGWENRRGKEYFNREPFEVDKPESYEVVGTQHRRDTRTYDARARLGGHESGEDSVSMYDAGDPFWTDFYQKNPNRGDGESMLDSDRELKDQWWPPEHQKIVDGAERRIQFTTEGEGYLAAVRATPFQTFSYPRPTAEPEISDWEDVSPKRAEFKTPELANSWVKRLAADFGATLARVTLTNPNWFYANGLRGAEEEVPYGEEFEIRPWWKYAIVVTRPMEVDSLYADPNFGSSYTGYNPSTYVAWHVGRAIRALGYPARVGAPMAGYEQFVVPFAVDAGFGELGRTCNCLSPDMGGNFRQSVIFTDLPLAVDKPVNVGIFDFCAGCKICAEYCHVDAISLDDEPNWEEAGVKRWDVNGFMCSTGWSEVSGRDSFPEGQVGRSLGGCRACIATCPWFRRNNWMHNAVRKGLALDPTGLGPDVALQFERALYPRNKPETWIAPQMLGVQDPPEWLTTDNYIKGFSDTPMKEA